MRTVPIIPIRDLWKKTINFYGFVTKIDVGAVVLQLPFFIVSYNGQRLKSFAHTLSLPPGILHSV